MMCKQKKEEEEKEEAHKNLQAKRDALRSKVLSVGRVLNLYKAMRQTIRDKNNRLGSPVKAEESAEKAFNVMNEPRPPGITQIIEASRNHRTPDQLRRRASRDNILFSKHKATGSFGSKIVIKDALPEGEKHVSSPVRRLSSLGDLGSTEFPSIQTTDTEPNNDGKELKS